MPPRSGLGLVHFLRFSPHVKMTPFWRAVCARANGSRSPKSQSARERRKQLRQRRPNEIVKSFPSNFPAHHLQFIRDLLRLVFHMKMSDGGDAESRKERSISASMGDSMVDYGLREKYARYTCTSHMKINEPHYLRRHFFALRTFAASGRSTIRADKVEADDGNVLDLRESIESELRKRERKVAENLICSAIRLAHTSRSFSPLVGAATPRPRSIFYYFIT